MYILGSGCSSSHLAMNTVIGARRFLSHVALVLRILGSSVRQGLAISFYSRRNNNLPETKIFLNLWPGTSLRSGLVSWLRVKMVRGTPVFWPRHCTNSATEPLNIDSPMIQSEGSSVNCLLCFRDGLFMLMRFADFMVCKMELPSSSTSYTVAGYGFDLILYLLA
jgi:hypothetical protein